MSDEEVNEFVSFLNSIGLFNLPNGWRNRIEILFQLVINANDKLNLTRILTFNEFLHKHVSDSLLLRAVMPKIETASLKIADIGCGAGFPGIPLALFFSHSNFTEIDSSRKKCTFVKSLIGSLGLENCHAVKGRARELARAMEFKEYFDLVLVRAVKSTAYLINECRQFLRRPNGTLIAYKTPVKIKQEHALAKREAEKHKLRLMDSRVFTLPNGYGDRQFFIVKHQKPLAKEGVSRKCKQ